MITRYCVFWIPTKRLNTPKLNPDHQVVDKDISDRSSISKYKYISSLIYYYATLQFKYAKIFYDTHEKASKIPSLLLSMKLDKEENICISVHNADREKIQDCILHREKESNNDNGLIVYRYEVAENEKSLLINTKIHNCIYHEAKGFYHIHEYHVLKGDSLFCCYTNESRPNVKDKNNNALMFYLRQYEVNFNKYLDDIFMHYNRLEGKMRSKSFRLYFYKSRCQKVCKNLISMCENAIGESIYYNCLAHSRYNSLFKIPYNHDECSGCTDTDKKSSYKKALNIANSINEIRLIKERTENLFTETTTKISKRLTYYGFFIAGFSFALTLYTIYSPNYDDLSQKISSSEEKVLNDLKEDIHAKHSSINSKLERIAEKNIVVNAKEKTSN